MQARIMFLDLTEITRTSGRRTYDWSEVTMAIIRLFYGTNTYNTEHVAQMIQQEMGDKLSSVTDIADAEPEDLASCDALILGTPTWNYGELPRDWENFLPKLDQVDLKGKKVALYGLGDALGYPDNFVDAMAILYQECKNRGAEIVGYWPLDDYGFLESRAVEADHFVGLVIDEDNEPDRTPERVKKWVEQIKDELSVG